MIVPSHSIVRATREPVLRYIRVDSPNVGCEGNLRIREARKKVAPCPLAYSSGGSSVSSADQSLVTR